MIYQMKPEPWEMLAQNNTTEEDAIAALQALNLTPINSPSGLSFISEAECGWTACPQNSTLIRSVWTGEIRVVLNINEHYEECV